MSKLLAYLKALDSDALVLRAHKNDPQHATAVYGLTEDERTAVLNMDRKGVATFLDIPFRDFDKIDSVETEPYARSKDVERWKEKVLAA